MLKFNLINFFLLGLLFQSAYAQPQRDGSQLSYDALLSNYRYTFDVNYFPFESQNTTLKMAYTYLEGDPDKPVVTLMHGKNFIGDYWASTAKFLKSQGYSVLIPDQIGFGKSSKPPGYQYSFAALANNTRKLMAALGIKKSIVVGHSMGGMLASRFALLYPEITQQLILINPIGLENYLQYVEYKDIDFFYKNELSNTAEKIRNYQRRNYYDGKWKDLYESLITYKIGQLSGPDKDLLAWVNAKTYDMIFTQPVITEFKNLVVPVTLIIGTRDRTAPGRNWKKPGVDYELGRFDLLGKKAVKIIPNATLYELHGLGHLPQIENFPKFKETLAKALSIANN
ncbi:alpha/beta fold hydrolase [Microbulbifer sp. TYP-18]|uniref:alpha/beta fold hydrolase n=1 Tax=Microbulbifer sp. TYP-18 TaxID=3230024 RepID=UPI0034C69E78